jgi:hypothetical protein
MAITPAQIEGFLAVAQEATPIVKEIVGLLTGLIQTTQGSAASSPAVTTTPITSDVLERIDAKLERMCKSLDDLVKK